MVQESIATAQRKLSNEVIQSSKNCLHHISEEELLARRVYFDVVQRVELSSKEIIEENSRVMGGFWVHGGDRRR